MSGTNVLSCLPTSSGMSLCHCLLLQLAISSYDHGQKKQTIITCMCSLPCCANEEPIKLLTWLWLCHMPVFCNIFHHFYTMESCSCYQTVSTHMHSHKVQHTCTQSTPVCLQLTLSSASRSILLRYIRVISLHPH